MCVVWWWPAVVTWRVVWQEVRTCSMLQQQLLAAHDAQVETLDARIVELEALCAGGTQSTLGSSAATMKTVRLGDDEEEEDFQKNPVSIQILQTMYSVRWRVLDRVSFMQCLQSQIEVEPIPLLPPVPPPHEACPEELAEVETLEPLRNILWPPAPEEGEGGEEAAAAGEEDDAEKKEEAAAAAAAARFSKLAATDERPKAKEGAPSTFTEAIDAIHEKQTAALEALVAKFFEELGDRAITRIEGAPACTAERFIPADLEAFNEKNAKRLAQLRTAAFESQKSKVRYLRSLVARISTVMGRVAGTGRSGVRGAGVGGDARGARDTAVLAAEAWSM